MLLIIDNYDSFTYNLVQRIGEHDIRLAIDREIRVVRNNQITIQEAVELHPDILIISPGPCTPNESGVCEELIATFQGKIPILGVCLGHQVIGALHGMKIMQYTFPVHGKTSPVFHDDTGIFKGLPNPFSATRYHSLVIEPESVPDSFVINAWTEDGVCMGIRWNEEGSILQGVQFHPESFLTTDGPQLLRNFLAERE